MSDQPDSNGSVFVVKQNGMVYVLKSVAAFSESPKSDDEKAAVEQLNSLLNGAQVCQVDSATLASMYKLLF